MERSYVNYELAPLNDEEEMSGFGKADVDLTPPKCRQFASLVQLVRLRLVIIIFVVLLANLALLLIFLQLKLHLFISNSARELQTLVILYYISGNQLMAAAIRIHQLNLIHSGNSLNLPTLWGILLTQEIPEIVCQTGYSHYLSY